MYTVAINIDNANQRYSMTVRDFERSRHWQAFTRISPSLPTIWSDSRETDVWKPFVQLSEHATETEARKFAAVIESAYSLAGWSRDLVKVTDTEVA